jgi:hypothetical protein
MKRDKEHKEVLKTFTPKQLKEWGYPVPTEKEEEKIEKERKSPWTKLKDVFPKEVPTLRAEARPIALRPRELDSENLIWTARRGKKKKEESRGSGGLGGGVQEWGFD